MYLTLKQNWFSGDNPKPPRTHHCNVCGRCIMKYDHHCPWIANCVGHFNHHYFILFLFYLCLGCTYAATLSFLPFWLSTDPTVPYNSKCQSIFFTEFLGTVARGTVVFSFILACACALSILLMLMWQSFLMLTAQTSLEFYHNGSKKRLAQSIGQRWRNPYG